MLPDRVSNPGPMTYESGALPIALRGPHKYGNIKKYCIFQAQISLECYFSCSYMLKCQQLLGV